MERGQKRGFIPYWRALGVFVSLQISYRDPGRARGYEHERWLADAKQGDDVEASHTLTLLCWYAARPCLSCIG
jgi:hypothetical protein